METGPRSFGKPVNLYWLVNSVPGVVVVVFCRVLTSQCPYTQRCNCLSAVPAPSRGDYGKYGMHNSQ